MSSQNIKIKPRPRSQSLLRTLGCLGGFCALLLSAFFVLGVMVYRLQSEELSIETIPPEDISSMDKNKIVQPLFINETRFDVVAAIWSPAPTNGSEASHWDEKGKKDHVYWKGILQENITFTDGNEKNVSLPMDLDLSFLWSLPNPNRYSLRASIHVVPRMESTALILPENSELVFNRTGTILGEKFPMNLSPLSTKEISPHLSDYWRDQILRKGLRGAFPAHTVPLLLILQPETYQEKEILLDQTEKYTKYFINSDLKVKLDHQTSSFKEKTFLKQAESAGLFLGRCLSKISTSTDDRELAACYNTNFYGPFQSRIEFVPELQSNTTNISSSSAFKHPEDSKIIRRSFFVPHLALETSRRPRDLVPIFRNETLAHFKWASRLRITSDKNNNAFAFTGERSVEISNQETLLANVRIRESSGGIEEDDTDFEGVFGPAFIIEMLFTAGKNLLELMIVIFGILYFYTRATTVSISLPAVLSSSVSFLIESVSNRWLLERNVRAFQQLWLVSRLQIKSSGKGRNFFRWIPTLARVPADHSERQSRREDEEFPIHYRLMALVLLTLLLSIVKPSCLYLARGAVGGFSLTKNTLSLVLLALPQTGLILGELQQLHLNHRQHSFAGAFKTTVILQAIRHSIEIYQAFWWIPGQKAEDLFPTAPRNISTSLLILNSSSILMTGCWVYQMLNYSPVIQLRDKDVEDGEKA